MSLVENTDTLARPIEALRTIGCDEFEFGLLAVLRHIMLGLYEADPHGWTRGQDIAVERWGEAVGLPAAYLLNKVALALAESREDGPEMMDPLCTEARLKMTDDEMQIMSMLHHMRRDKASGARSAVAFVTRGRMDPDLIRAGLSFSHRFPAGVKPTHRKVGRPKLSVVA
ncbi:hypothetical protein J7413_05995 [Shimia sp. R10_1]|uniref:hypothetical protein n=1 Tax=Shimia sp. R10_1 TaxID=2821095 RepID=UPI001ADB1538|nr:hypothetical protein [Shimia sp. R10_1]MBO9473087.1 hypothetical protein [Shimia sp. R10_1]